MVIGDKVMHIVATLPPANREATAKVSNEHAYQRVDDVIMRYASVSGIVGSKHDLMLRKVSQRTSADSKVMTNPEEAEEGCRSDIPPGSQAGKKDCKDCDKS